MFQEKKGKEKWQCKKNQKETQEIHQITQNSRQAMQDDGNENLQMVMKLLMLTSRHRHCLRLWKSGPYRAECTRRAHRGLRRCRRETQDIPYHTRIHRPSPKSQVERLSTNTPYLL